MRAQWGTVEYLLAEIYDVLNVSRWQFAAANSRKGRKPKRPRPFPRPGVVDPNRQHMGTARMSLEQAKAWMQQRRKGVTRGKR